MTTTQVWPPRLTFRLELTAYAADTVTFSNKTLTAPKFADLGFIADSNGNEMLSSTCRPPR